MVPPVAGLRRGVAVVRRQVERRLLFLRARRRCRADAHRARSVDRKSDRGRCHPQGDRPPARSGFGNDSQHVQSIYTKLEVVNVAGFISALKRAD